MPPVAEDRLRDIQRAAGSIATFLMNSDYDAFVASDALMSQVYWKVAVIREAAAGALRLRPDLQDTIPELLNLSDVRNRVIHGYENISNPIIWTIIHALLPPVLVQISDYLGDREA